MIQLIVTIDDDEDYPMTPEEAARLVQQAINSDLRCPDAKVDVPGV